MPSVACELNNLSNTATFGYVISFQSKAHFDLIRVQIKSFDWGTPPYNSFVVVN